MGTEIQKIRLQDAFRMCFPHPAFALQEIKLVDRNWSEPNFMSEYISFRYERLNQQFSMNVYISDDIQNNPMNSNIIVEIMEVHKSLSTGMTNYVRNNNDTWTLSRIPEFKKYLKIAIDKTLIREDYIDYILNEN